VVETTTTIAAVQVNTQQLVRSIEPSAIGEKQSQEIPISKRNGFNIDLLCLVANNLDTSIFFSLSPKGDGIQPLTPSAYLPPLPHPKGDPEHPDPSSLNTICYCKHRESKMVQAPPATCN